MGRPTAKERIVGSIMGALVGDALGLGPHWYYDLDELRRDYGDWVSGYTDPKPGRFHACCSAGDVSQTGQVYGLLLDSVSERGAYDEVDFTGRLDGFLATLDGTPEGGRYTDEAMRELWKGRKAGKAWDRAAGFAFTAEAAIRMPILAGRYAKELPKAFEAMQANALLTHRDPQVRGMSVGFGLVVLGLLGGVGLDKVSGTIRLKFERAGLSFDMPSRLPGEDAPAHFIDDVLLPRWSWEAATDPAVRIEPPQAACRMFGLACFLSFLAPAAYYLAARFPENFEMAVLSAINGGGNNMARASLTGALAGAMNGIGGIPERFITGLTGHDRYLKQAESIADAALAS